MIRPLATKYIRTYFPSYFKGYVFGSPVVETPEEGGEETEEEEEETEEEEEETPTEEVTTYITDSLDIANSTSFTPLVDTTYLKNKTEFSAKMVVDVDATSEGILLEAGRTGQGFILYAYQGNLVVSGGAGTNVETNPDSIFGETPLPTGSVIEVVATLSYIRVYCDGTKVIDATGTIPTRVTGNDAGAFGKVGGNYVVSNRAGYSSTNVGTYNKTLTSCHVWLEVPEEIS